MKTTKTISIEIPEGKRTEWVDGVLTLVDDTPQDITERIKTFEDACEWCCENHNRDLYLQYADALNVGLQRAKDILAYLKLRIITCALNEGWEPTFEEFEKCYHPCYNEYYEEKLIVTGNRSKSSDFPTKLYFRFPKHAKYAATQFKDIYMDFFYKGKETDAPVSA